MRLVLWRYTLCVCVRVHSKKVEIMTDNILDTRRQLPTLIRSARSSIAMVLQQIISPPLRMLCCEVVQTPGNSSWYISTTNLVYMPAISLSANNPYRGINI